MCCSCSCRCMHSDEMCGFALMREAALIHWKHSISECGNLSCLKHTLWLDMWGLILPLETQLWPQWLCCAVSGQTVSKWLTIAQKSLYNGLWVWNRARYFLFCYHKADVFTSRVSHLVIIFCFFFLVVMMNNYLYCLDLSKAWVRVTYSMSGFDLHNLGLQTEPQGLPRMDQITISCFGRKVSQFMTCIDSWFLYLCSISPIQPCHNVADNTLYNLLYRLDSKSQTIEI